MLMNTSRSRSLRRISGASLTTAERTMPTEVDTTTWPSGLVKRFDSSTLLFCLSLDSGELS